MKKISAILILCLIVLSSFTNENKLSSYLGEVFSSERVEEIVSSPELAKYYNNVLFNSYSFEKIPPEKPLNPNWKVLTSVNVVSKEKKYSVSSINSLVKAIENDYFNILRYQLVRNYDTINSYVLGNTGIVLHIKPHTYLTKLQQK